MIRQVEYFDRPGPGNSQRCLEICRDALSTGYKDIVIASSVGESGELFARGLSDRPGLNLVVVTHSVGFSEKNKDEFDPEKKKTIESMGGRVLTATILTHSLETALAGQHKGAYPTIIVAQTLRRLGQGTKVCCEIVMEACDAGLILEGKEVIAVGGTARGSDTVCIIESAVSKRFLQLKVKEILAKPREW